MKYFSHCNVLYAVDSIEKVLIGTSQELWSRFKLYRVLLALGISQLYLYHSRSYRWHWGNLNSLRPSDTYMRR